jgi:hypothetical protein
MRASRELNMRGAAPLEVSLAKRRRLQVSVLQLGLTSARRRPFERVAEMIHRQREAPFRGCPVNPQSLAKATWSVIAWVKVKTAALARGKPGALQAIRKS